MESTSPVIRGLLPLLIAKDLDVNHPTTCGRAPGAGGAYCDSCDLLLSLDGLHVLAVERGPDLLTVTVESAPGPVGCPSCGVLAEAVHLIRQCAQQLRSACKHAGKTEGRKSAERLFASCPVTFCVARSSRRLGVLTGYSLD